jgi:CRISPR-associated protein Cmr3
MKPGQVQAARADTSQLTPVPGQNSINSRATQAQGWKATPQVADAGRSRYLLHPTSPLVFGTGRPSDFGLGGQTLDFPFPATVAGAIRAALQVAKDQPPEAHADANAAKVFFLALARLPALGTADAPTLLFARPADAVYIGGHVVPLRPSKLNSETEYSDLPSGIDGLELAQDQANIETKPDLAPAWWSANVFANWLNSAKEQEAQRFQGDVGPIRDMRTHVVIDAIGKGAVEGGLFRSTGLDFGASAGRSRGDGGYALAVETDARSLNGAARRLGGEGRFVRFEQLEPLLPLPKKPDGLEQAQLVRCILITPAVFANNGWFPDWMTEDEATGTRAGRLPTPGPTGSETVDLQIVLKAAAIVRAQSYSGWQPKSSESKRDDGPGQPYRVVPAGSVYWFEVPAGAGPQLWMKSLCMEPWASDGWGICLVGLA